MATSERPDLRATLRRQLRERMVARDKPAVDVLRVAIAAIENAEAHPLDPSSQTELHLEASPSSDVPRRVLSDGDARALVAGEIDELLTAARRYDTLGETEASVRAEEQATVLREILRSGSEAPP